jgi:hypothetical protein
VLKASRMSLVTGGRTPGALYELVARGAKDKYFFIRDASNNSVIPENPFSSVYEPTAPRIPETRSQQPLNAADFGRPVEFQLETFGDILTDMTVLIDLPAWFDSLPVTAAAGAAAGPQAVRQSVLANDWRCADADASGVTFGYTNGIGYTLFERIQLFQDRIMLVDITGDSLQAMQATDSSWNWAYLTDRLVGKHDGSVRSIGINAQPGRLRLRLPWPGCQNRDDGGFPLCAARSQNFRVRLVLRRLEDIIEGSDGRFFPKPWAADAGGSQKIGPVRNFKAVDVNGVTMYTTSLPREKIGAPTVQLETTQLYISPADSEALQKATLQIPFRNYEDQEYTANEPDYAPFDKATPLVPIRRRLEGSHPVERVLWYFREVQALQAGQRWKLTADTVYAGPSLNTTRDFYTGLKLIIAGQDREDLWPPAIWQEVESYVKDDKWSGRQQNEMRWSLGSQFERPAGAARQLEGAVNFSTADRPTFYMNLLNVLHNPVTQQRKTFLQICTEQWDVMEFEGGRCRMLFMN